MASRARVGGDLARLVADLRKYDNGKFLQRELRREMRQAVRPAVTAVRGRVMGLPSKGESKRRGRPGLRQTVARATRATVRTGRRTAGIEVMVSRRAVGRKLGNQNLASYLEGERPFHRWKHPVYGRKATVVPQASHPFFYNSLRPLEPRVLKDAEDIISRMARDLQR